MFRIAMLAAVVAVAGSGSGRGTLPNAKLGALKCANPQLPTSILQGGNAAVTDALSAAPLSVVTVDGANTPLTLAVASDVDTRNRGLMCVTALRPNAGMLFVFPQTRDWNFWMKDTVVSLDMIWVEGDGTVSAVAANVPAASLTTPDARVAHRDGHGKYVIELRAGAATRYGIAVGTRLRIPALDAT